MRKLEKGFTLIELLVVIAIIGILASVVLASLNSARNKGANTAVKANLTGMRSQAEIIYDSASPNSYDTVCADTTITTAGAAAVNAGGGTFVCNDSATAWAASTALKVAEGTSNYWCVDSTGVSQGEAAALRAATAC